MGRGGGGGGSHRSGGGSFHYSSGGRSGRSSSSHSSRSSGTSYRTRTVYYGSGYSGPMSLVMGWVLIVTILFVFVAMMLLQREGVPKSTREREKLSASECTVINEWYRDDIEWISDISRLERGLKSFYNSTGVQPYLWITDNINGKSRPNEADFQNALNQMYNELFDDEGHVIVCFLESSPNDWATYDWCGDAARNVMDDEAEDILHSYFSRYYTSDMEDEEYLATVFTKTGNSIMTVDKSNKAIGRILLMVIVIVGGVIITALIVHIIVKNKKEQAKINRDILNTDIKEIKEPLEEEHK